jgi:hypothetical protein
MSFGVQPYQYLVSEAIHFIYQIETGIQNCYI